MDEDEQTILELSKDPVDEDKLTISELLKYSKKDESFGIRQSSESVKLSGQDQKLACRVAEESSVNTMKLGEDIVSTVDNGCASSSTLFEKRLWELNSRCTRLESLVSELEAHSFGKSLLLWTNHPSVPPGFPHKHKGMEAEEPMDEEDKLTISEVLKYRKKHESGGIRQSSDLEKLSDQAHSASPVAEESSINMMTSDEGIVSIVGNGCASSSSLFDQQLRELKTRCTRLERKFQEENRTVEISEKCFAKQPSYQIFKPTRTNCFLLTLSHTKRDCFVNSINGNWKLEIRQNHFRFSSQN
ncbi:hypothetical protein DVH24_004193 [Malus domestica]|uniref:Uncharacterized protein n=1 Tax=Malus domestica TaxID=3750 RepID=A0A498K7Q9_MALDO|nr:hypothetical protein DVH24_004193 [Malus domestica]